MKEALSIRDKPISNDLLVVVADDCEDLREVLTQSLRSADFQVVEASNGKEALDVITKNKLSDFFLVTDFNMPGLRGDQLINVLEDYKEGRVLGYGLISSHFDTQPEIKDILSKKLRASIRFFEKPLSMNDLIQYLQMFKSRSFKTW